LSAISQRLAVSGPVPEAALPADTFVKEHELFVNRDSIRFIHVPNAHTDGDSVVYFRRNDVLVAGDIFVTTAFPYIDVAHGGTLQGIIDGLDLLLDLAIPGPAEEGGTLIIPGHGRLCDEGDLVEYRDMLVIIRDRIQSLIAKGATLEQIKAAQPTRDYDLRYGMGAPGGMNTEMFIEAAYKTLIKK
jgi:glyoxylase-like metal-dependent hydrolase (beta-lactamase superfamily II)